MNDIIADLGTDLEPESITNKKEIMGIKAEQHKFKMKMNREVQKNLYNIEVNYKERLEKEKTKNFIKGFLICFILMIIIFLVI